jgi:NADPH-dependent 2,4-dienoyl-CoA reductase/sulfur reductase-like enzyme
MTAVYAEPRPWAKSLPTKQAPAQRKRVVIIGGGFAGIAAARAHEDGHYAPPP